MRRSAPFASVLALMFTTAAQAQSLPIAISEALAHAPMLAAAKAEEEAARAQLAHTKAQSNPSVALEASWGTGRMDNGGFFTPPLVSPSNMDPLALKATAEMPLFAGGRIAAAIAQARAQANFATSATEAARLETILNMVNVYAAVRTSRQIEAQYKVQLSELSEILRHAELRFRAGDIPASDLAQAKARKAEAQAGLAQVLAQRLMAENAYQRLTGKAPDLLGPLPPLPQTVTSLDEALDMARQSYPQLRQAQMAVDVARAGKRAAEAESLPSIGAFAEAAHVRDQFFPGYKGDHYTVGVRGRWTLWAGGRTAAQIQSANATYAARQAELRNAEDQLVAMVIDAWQLVQSTRQIVDAAQLRQQAAAESFRSIKLENSVGTRTMSDILNAERETLAAEAALLQAQGQQIFAIWQLNAITGNIS